MFNLPPVSQVLSVVFPFSGRLTRAEFVQRFLIYLGGGVVVFGINNLAMDASAGMAGVLMGAYVVGWAGLLLFMLASMLARFRDTGFRPWLFVLLLFLVPVFLFLMALFWPSRSAGPTNWDVVIMWILAPPAFVLFQVFLLPMIYR